nr:Rpn family recombination-promoting nuclease/putative transposase [Desulforamulus profundi]
MQRRPKDALEEWLLYFNNIVGEEMEEIAMGNPGIRKAMTIEQIFFKNQQERRLYELREKAARDEISMVAGAWPRERLKVRLQWLRRLSANSWTPGSLKIPLVYREISRKLMT